MEPHTSHQTCQSRAISGDTARVKIKTYSNKPAFINDHFMVKEGYYIIGDGAGTSRGITAVWASGIRATEGIMGE